jgi:hypothetical protein
VHSPRRRALHAWLVAAGLVAAALSRGAATAAAQPPPIEAGRPDDAEIEQALDSVRADPNLSPQRKVRTLRWTGGREQTPRAPWLIWIVQTAMWAAESARRLVWIAGGVLLAMLVVYVLGRWKRRPARGAELVFNPPTHVRDLDIRPETLPADIGAAARALWGAGDRRAALALLYRGLLSRLIHVHRVPIRDSSTEGDCLELAAGHLAETPRRYAAALIRAWQRFVYGGEEIETPLVQTLCDEFSTALDGKAAERLQGVSA